MKYILLCVGKIILFSILISSSLFADSNTSKSLLFGMASGISPFLDWENQLNKMQQAGVKIIRVNYPKDRANIIEEMDRFVLGAQQRGMDVLITFNFDKFPGTPGSTYSSLGELKQTAKSVAERYDNDGIEDVVGLSGAVLQYEIGNEPSFCGIFNGTTSEYVQMLQAGYEGVKEACANCKVLNGGLFDSADQPPAGTCPDGVPDYQTYFDEMLSLGADHYFDVLSIHIYHMDGSSWDDMIPFYKSRTSKQIWVTETGFSSSSKFASTPDRQAKEVIRRFVKQFEQGASGVFHFTLNDKSTDRIFFDNCGIYNSFWSAKPAYSAYNTMVSKIGDATQVVRVEGDVYRCVKSSGLVYVAWSDTGGGLPSSITGTVKVTDYFGNEQTMDASAVVLTSSPVFIEFDSSSGAPSAPTGLSASKGAYTDKVLVYWTAVSSATNYNVWRGVDTNSQNAFLIGTCTTAFYLDTSTTPDILYDYWIQAVNAAGTSELSVPDSGYCGSIANLTSPTGLQASDGSYTDRIRITWQAVGSATRYEVWRNTENNRSTASLIKEQTGTSYDDLSVDQGIYYYYWLKARTAHRDGDFSESDAGLRRLSAPAGVSASNGSYPYHIRVVWNAVANAVWYEVWREEVPPGINSDGVNLVKVAQTGEVYFNDYYTKSGVYYRYKVKSCNGLSSSLDYGHNTGYRHVTSATTLSSTINDYDGDKLSDLALFNPLSGVLDVLCSALGRQTFIIGAEHSQGITGDYDGDRVADPVAYCPGSGTWLARLSSIGYNPIIRVSFSPGRSAPAEPGGGNGNNPVAADFDGDGLADIGVYNEKNGVLSAILSNGGAFDIRASCLMGGPGYRFVSADFDGDGLADPTVYSESEGRVTVIFSGNEYSSASAELGGQGISIYAADFDGDGLADPVLYEEATGIWTFLFSSIEYRGAKILFGGPGYVPIIGDYDGDGLADPAIYRETDGQWLITFSTGGYSVVTDTFGGTDYQPMME